MRIHLGCWHPCCVLSLQDSRRVIQELESKTQQLSKELKAANDEKSVGTHVINSRVTFFFYLFNPRCSDNHLTAPYSITTLLPSELHWQWPTNEIYFIKIFLLSSSKWQKNPLKCVFVRLQVSSQKHQITIGETRVWITSKIEERNSAKEIAAHLRWSILCLNFIRRSNESCFITSCY